MATRLDGEHCSFVLLAEFDIFEGAQLKHQFPQDVGVNEGVLAMSMLPDGAETQMDDWTVFFLNQTPFNAVTASPSVNPDERTPLLYVLNLVRTKHDKTMKRGGIVRALAICTRHSAIHMFKPLLHLAMDAYFADPSVSSLARLYEAINNMDISGAPSLSRSERLIMRGVERKDVFWEKFANRSPSSSYNTTKRKDSHDSSAGHSIIHPISETPDAIEGELCVTPTESSLEHDAAEHITTPERKLSFPSTSPSLTDSLGRSQPLRYWSLRGAGVTESISRPASFSDESHSNSHEGSVGSDVSVVGDDTLIDRISLDDPIDMSASTTNIPNSLRPLEIPNHDDIPYANYLKAKTDDEIATDDMNTTPTNQNPRSELPRTELVKTASFHTDIPDTHFYHTSIEFQGHKLPIKLPLYTFSEEVGDYSLVSLFKVFSSTNLVTGPVHPHLHTNGAQTHPIIILFNALITAKRILFLGHKRPAGEVSQFVLAACALGSGCGVMTGFIKRAFPYATLENKDEWEAVFETTVADMTTVILRLALRPAYIAGVTNPIFESLRMWDVLFDIASGQVTVSKTIFSAYPLVHLPQIGGTSLVSRMAAPTRQESVGGADNDATKLPATNGVKPEFLARSEASMDSLFIEDIATAIEYRYGENYVRMKFTEYTMRFLRLASRYEEEITGATAIGYTSAPYHEGSPGRPAKLGSGMVFRDEAAFMKEIVANASRVEAWRRTEVYRNYAEDFQVRSTSALHKIDVLHQLSRLRQGGTMSDTEVALIMHTLTANVRSYEQVVEFLSYLIPGTGGLLPVAFGLFHQKELIREMTVDFLNQLRTYPIGVIFLQGLNYFQRYAYVRQACALEKRLTEVISPLSQQGRQSTSYPPRSNSKSSRTSLPANAFPKLSRTLPKRSMSSNRPSIFGIAA